MMDASICGLGQAAPNPALTRDEILPARGAAEMERVTTAAARDDADRVQAQRQDGRSAARTRRSSRRRRSTASTSRTSATAATCARTATAAPAWSRSRASARWRRRAAASPRPGWKSPPTPRARCRRRRWCSSCCCPTCRRQEYTLDNEVGHWAKKLGVGKPRFAVAQAAEGRHLASGDRGQPRRLHPVHALRARLPRGAGERRHRLRLPRRALEDRVRLRRPDGRVDLRRLRRVRAGLPDRRADAGARGRPAEASTRRSTRSARSAASAACSPTTSRRT